MTKARTPFDLTTKCSTSEQFFFEHSFDNNSQLLHTFRSFKMNSVIALPPNQIDDNCNIKETNILLKMRHIILKKLPLKPTVPINSNRERTFSKENIRVRTHSKDMFNRFIVASAKNTPLILLVIKEHLIVLCRKSTSAS